MKNLLLPTLMSLFAVTSVNAVPQDLLLKLDADEFATRSKAQSDLMKWAQSAKKDQIKELKKAYEGTESPEVRMRLLDVLDNSTFMARPNTRGFVGITMDPKVGGVGILRVEPNTPAQKVDLRVGDVIVEVDEKDLTQKKANIDEATTFFSNYVKSKKAGEKLKLKVNRNGKILEKTLKLGDYDKFNKQFLNQAPQQFLLNGNQLQMNGRPMQLGPNVQLQMRVVPQGVEPPNVEELLEARKKQLKKVEEMRQKMELKKKELEELKKKLGK